MEALPLPPGEHDSGRLFDDRADLYRKSGDLVISIARHHARMDVDETTQERWRQLMGLMREVDTWADETDAKASEVLDGLSDFSLFKNRYPDLTPQALGPECHAKLVHHAGRILKLGEFASRQTDLKRYADLRAGEARRSVELFALTATPEVTAQPQFDAKFMPTIKALGEAATLWDSAIDGWDDARNGMQAIRPSPKFLTYLTARMIARGKGSGRAMLHPSTIKPLLIKGWLRITNRVRNGVPEYSNLRLLRRRRSDG